MKLFNRKRDRVILGLILALGASGCEVGPNYRHPEADVPAGFALTTRPTTNPVSVADAGQTAWVNWWTKFNDEKLNSLVSRSLAANHELKIAAARVREAR